MKHAQKAPMIEVSSLKQTALGQPVWSDVVRHGMATPLAVARGCVDHLRQESSNLSEADRHQIFEALDRAVATLERLSGNLRSDARLEAGVVTEDFEDICVAVLLREVISGLTAVACQRNVEIMLKDSTPSSVPFRGASSLVRQAVENLLTNAIKHSPRGSPVEVTCRQEDRFLWLAVSDHGDGIPPSARDQIFERYGVTGPLSDRPTGMGFGLSIVKRVVEAHGGRVGVVSELGDGSTFWMSFPLGS